MKTIIILFIRVYSELFDVFQLYLSYIWDNQIHIQFLEVIMFEIVYHMCI